VFFQLIAVIGRDLALQLLDLMAFEFDDLAAVHVDHMVVVATTVQLVNGLATLEIVLEHEAGGLELGQHPVDRRQADLVAMLEQLAVDVLGGHVVLVVLGIALFEQRLAEHEQPGSQLTSARAMFDLWIEVAEEAYAKVAMSEPFQQVYASLGNAQMRLRAGLQREVEQMSERIGLPTRSEMDAAHRRIAELERSLRRLQAQVAVLAGTAEVDPVAQPAPAKVKPTARKAAKKAAPAKKAPAKRTSAKKTSAKKAAPRAGARDR